MKQIDENIRWIIKISLLLIIPPFQGLPPEEIDATKDDLIGEGGRIRDGMLEDVVNNDDSTMNISDNSFGSFGEF